MARIWRGMVVKPLPASSDQLINIVIPDMNPDLVFGGLRWDNAGGRMPAAGDDCLVVFDNNRQPWVLVTWPIGEMPEGHVYYTNEWRWTSSTSDASHSGDVGTNAAGWGGTAINVSKFTAPGRDVTLLLDNIGAGDALYIQDFDDASRWARYLITGPASSHGSWYSIPVTTQASSSSPPTTNPSMTVTLITRGAVPGTAGPPGPPSTVPGPPGPQGPASTIPGPPGPASTVPG